jgi:sec-independent protein translocase protein TatB
MFDIGWQELFIVAAIAIVVVGPRDLPRVLKTVMSMVRKARGMAREFQSGIDDVVREVELDDLRKEANSMANMDLEDEVKSALDPTGDLEKDMNMDEVQKTIQETAEQMKGTPARTEDAVDFSGPAETFGGAGPVDPPEAPIISEPVSEPASSPVADTEQVPTKEASS